MKLLKSKRGLSEGMLNRAIMLIILGVVLFQLYAELIPELQVFNRNAC